MINEVKEFIARLRYKRFERKIKRAIAEGKDELVINGVEIKIKQNN